LIKILLECGQEIPEFLADQKPAEGEPLVFDDDSGADDDEGESTGDGGGAGAGGGDAGNGGSDGSDAWGSVKPVAATLVVDNDNWDAGNDKGGW
jgi:ATP-dependent RNA helicase DDX3X